MREMPMHAIVLKQVSVERRITQIIDGNHLDPVAVTVFVECSQHIATDTAETIDSYS
jgi:hypothetical protein